MRNEENGVRNEGGRARNAVAEVGSEREKARTKCQRGVRNVDGKVRKGVGGARNEERKVRNAEGEEVKLLKETGMDQS